MRKSFEDQMEPVKRIAQFKIEPKSNDLSRVIPEDYLSMIETHEFKQGRLNVRVQQAFGLIDFISEEADGESRLIVVTEDIHQFKQQLVEEDYHAIKSNVFVYEVAEKQIIEHKLEQGLLFV